MKYKPEPVIEEEQIEEHEVYLPGGNSYTVDEHTKEKTGWEVQFEEDGGGYIFGDQDDAMMFCLLLEIRDLLEDKK
jgi:hypothetical protein